MKPVREKTLELLQSIRHDLGDNFLTRVLCCIYLFDFLDRLRLKKFPADWFSLLETELHALRSTAHFLSNALETSGNSFDAWQAETATTNDIQAKTGEVYFNLWKNFSKDEYYDQAYELLADRFRKNSITVADLGKALDDGCGGGRYSMALRKLGFAQVVGIDVSPNSVAFARRMNPFPAEEVNFINGSVLALPFEAEEFDFVFSNGVLHHTYSTETGLKEIHRVLKKGGRCWLYLYGGKESFFWDVVDFSRDLLLNTVPQHYTQTVMKAMGYPPGRIFHRSDFFYVPINNRYFADEVEDMVRQAGFFHSQRLRRGAGHDWDEILHQNPHIDPYLYGEGEMRYLLIK